METSDKNNTGSRMTLTGLIGIVCFLLAIGGGVGFYHFAKVLHFAESGHAVVGKALSTRAADTAAALEYQTSYDDMRQAYRRTGWILGGVVLTALIVLALYGYYFSHRVTVPLRKLSEAMRRVSRGDLTVLFPLRSGQRNEISQIADALNVLVTAFADNMRKVGESAHAVTIGAQELTAASDRLSSSAQEQASSLEETAASMEEMTGTVKQNADNAVQADKLSVESTDAANEGVVMASSIKRSMDLIDSSSKKIADIIGVIDEIAFQTNLLALNAAVEAARAGEHGRGFAVVASEVRSLAQRSAQAAKEIKSLINDSMDRVGDGTHLVSVSGAKLEGIAGKVKKVADLVSEISAASQEQAVGIEQVNRAIMQMDTVTQSNAAQVEELSGTSQSLAMQAEHLKALVSYFTLSAAVPSVMTEESGRLPLSGMNQDSAVSATNVEMSMRGAKVKMLKPKRAMASKAGVGNDWTEL